MLKIISKASISYQFLYLQHRFYEALPEGDADEVDSDDEDEGDDENKLLRYNTFIKPHIFVLIAFHCIKRKKNVFTAQMNHFSKFIL